MILCFAWVFIQTSVLGISWSTCRCYTVTHVSGGQPQRTLKYRVLSFCFLILIEANKFGHLVQFLSHVTRLVELLVHQNNDDENWRVQSPQRKDWATPGAPLLCSRLKSASVWGHEKERMDQMTSQLSIRCIWQTDTCMARSDINFSRPLVPRKRDEYNVVIKN